MGNLDHSSFKEIHKQVIDWHHSLALTPGQSVLPGTSEPTLGREQKVASGASRNLGYKLVQKQIHNKTPK